MLINFVPKNLQNKKFCVKLGYECSWERFKNSEHIIYSLLFIHMKMKKLLVGAFLWIFTLAWVAVLPNYASAGDFKSSDWFKDGGGFNKQDTQYNVDVAWSNDMQNDSLIKVIKTAINWVLGILSLIALALCLWGGFQMMTSGGDSKKYEAGLNLLKWAAIGLAVIATSWLIVSLVFYVINGAMKGGNQDEATGKSQQEQTR